MKTLFETYIGQGFKALRCAGYHSSFNKETDEEKRYKRAKAPITEGYAKPDYQGLKLDDCKKWEAEGGWIGWVIPPGIVVLDIDKEGWQQRFATVRDICKRQGITPPIHRTNNGVHVFFKASENIPGNAKGITKAGFKVTYRAGGKNQLILACVI